MNAPLILAAPAPRLDPLGEILARQRALALYGLLLLLLAIPAALAQAIDPAQLDGVSVWAKPTKFLVSIGIFALTAAWFFGYVRPERRDALPMRASAAVLIVAGSLEIAYIAFQAARGEASHFNTSSGFHILMYVLMGLFAVLLVGTVLPLAWEIARRPAAHLRRDHVQAAVIGLLLTFILGGGLGGYMSAQFSHSVGAEGARVPVFGWNRSGGDLRIAHFMGIHAQQAIPLLAALATGFAASVRGRIVWGGSALYVAITIAVFAQAVTGRALLPL